MSYQFDGSCVCGRTKITIKPSSSLNKFILRACDCDFCTSREINYLSDPAGKAEIHAFQPLRKLKQGSNQAEFLCCANCDSVVAVGYWFQVGLRGAINATLLNDKKHLQVAVPASPKLLEPDEKVKRWEKLWMTIELYDH